MSASNQANDEPRLTPVGNVSIVNLEQKKKPHNVNIRNHNPHEPKINANTKYSVKQSFRRYKTKKEPNLINKIQANEDDDIVNKIKEAFGIKPENAKGYTIGNPNTNYSEEITAPSAYNNGVDEPPVTETKMYNSDRHAQQERRQGQQQELHSEQNHARELAADFSDIGRETQEELTSQLSESSDMAIDDPSKELFLKHWNDSEAKVFSEREQEAIKKIRYNYQKHLSRKEGKAVRQDLEGAMILTQMNKDYDLNRDITVTPMKRRNKVVGLDYEETTSPQRTQRYSLGLDRALPTPEQFKSKQNSKIKTQDAQTSPRNVGRPRNSDYFRVNPPRVSTGEMTNPATAF